MTTEQAHMLTDAEKRLRDWLMQHPDGGEMWMIVKGGFRRSYTLGKIDALRDAADAMEQFEPFPGEEPDWLRERATALRLSPGKRAE